jgi:RIO-like serine/threonine protein kinase
MTNAETRVLRFLQAAGVHQKWVPYSTILNTEDLLPGDEKALKALWAHGLIEKEATEPAYRISKAGAKAIGKGASDAL